MAQVIILAKHKRIANPKETKFCNGRCQKDLPINNFPDNGERICKSCQSEKSKAKYIAKKKEKEMWGI